MRLWRIAMLIPNVLVSSNIVVVAFLDNELRVKRVVQDVLVPPLLVNVFPLLGLLRLWLHPLRLLI